MASTKSENDESTREDEHRAEEEESTASDGEGQDSDEEGSDEEGSDEEGSDEEGSDDDESGDEEDSGDESGESDDDESAGDEGSDDEESRDQTDDSDESASAGGAADAEAPGPTQKKKSGKGGPRRHKKDGMTAGARLAAAKAAKAARKAAKLGKEKKDQDPMAQVRESPLVQKAEQASSWAKENRTMVLALVAALVLGLGGWVGYRYYSDQQAQAAATLLEDALEMADAQIVAEDDASDEERDEDDPPTFPSEQARAEASLEAFRAVITQYPSSTAATWARLGEARALFELGQYEEARQSYDHAADEGGSDPAIVWRALEGKGFTFEAEEQWAEALESYEQLASIDERRFEPVAKYHMARMYLAQGEREQATETLRTLVESLREAADDEEAQDFGYVLAQAQTRLRELDPSAAPPPPAPSLDSFGAGGGGPGGGDISPEQLQELIRRFQQQQQQQGAGGGAGE